MHDPSTHLYDIPIPFTGSRHYAKDGSLLSVYRSPLVSFWHDDPEAGGSDDSCDWFGSRPTEADRDWARKEGASEWSFMFGPEFGGMRTASAFEVAYTVWATIAWRRFKRRKPFGARELGAIIGLAAGHASDTIASTVDRARSSEEECGSLFVCVLRNYHRFHRPWYRHPRWHVHHWRLQFPPVQALKRWAFSRCATCGRRFPWGYSPVSNSWNGTGPRWFRGEEGVMHYECTAPRIVAVSE